MDGAARYMWGVYVDGQEGPLLLVDAYHLAHDFMLQLPSMSCLDAEDLELKRVRVAGAEAIDPKDDPNACEKCGCTEDRACDAGCCWIIVPTDTVRGLCSSCAPAPKARRRA